MFNLEEETNFYDCYFCLKSVRMMKLGITANRLEHVQNMSEINGAKTDILLWILAYTILEVNQRIRSFIVVRVENLVEVDYFKDTYKSAFLPRSRSFI